MRRGLPVGEQVDAKRVRYDRAAALKLARSVGRVVSIRGASRITFEMRRQPPADDELAKALLGPTGNLRAPALRSGDTLYVGFHPEAFETRGK